MMSIYTVANFLKNLFRDILHAAKSVPNNVPKKTEQMANIKEIFAQPNKYLKYSNVNISANLFKLNTPFNS